MRGWYMTGQEDTNGDTDISHPRQSVLLFGAHVLEDGFGCEICRGLGSSLDTVVKGLRSANNRVERPKHQIKGILPYAAAAELTAAYRGAVRLKYRLPSTRNGATINCEGARLANALEAMARFSLAMPLLVARMRLSLRTAIARCALIAKGRDVPQRWRNSSGSRFGEKITRLVVTRLCRRWTDRPSLRFLAGSHGSPDLANQITRNSADSGRRVSTLTLSGLTHDTYILYLLSTFQPEQCIEGISLPQDKARDTTDEHRKENK